ncbi:ATP-dependent bile acid permease [Meredithblackwellia eburnea MCA 4105]
MPWIKPSPLRDPGSERDPIPEGRANWLERTTFGWCWPLLKVGYSRPLEKEDLWALPESRLADTIGTELEYNFYSRVPPERRPRHLRDQILSRTTSPSGGGNDDAKDDLPNPVTATRTRESMFRKKEEKYKNMTEEQRKKKFKGNEEGGRVLGGDGRSYDQSLIWAISKTFAWPFYSSAVFMIMSSLLQTLSPMITKHLLAYITDSYIWHKVGGNPEAASALGATRPAGVGVGIGYAVGLWAMQQAASLFQNQYMQLGMAVGMLMRTSLISLISRKSLRLSGAARVKHPNGHLITLVSSDASFMEWSAFLVHGLWVLPLQIIIGIILLIVYLGYSALVGVAVLVLNTPIQGLFVTTMFRARQEQLKVVDQRVRLIQEVLNGIRVIKLYAYETFFKGRISKLRGEELSSLRKIALVRSGMSASMSFVPVAAAVLSFITYSLSGHKLDAPTIFASLQLFNVIRQPLMMLPMAWTVSSDAFVALKRVTRALLAEELDNELIVNPAAKFAVRATGNFAWETSGPQQSMMASLRADARQEKKAKAEAKKKAKEANKAAKKGQKPAEEEKKKEEKPPFELRDIDLKLGRGELICIVGSVGSGKSSLLQALIGEMKRLDGEVIFGGTTSYFPQSPWVQNATLRDNILFGQPYDEFKFDGVISACALEPDIAILPNGLDTEIGEKGINSSGGQKARVCLARAAYFGADIVLLDDPLSAVDAHVSKQLVENCITAGPLAGMTRILVTHHLEVLPHADHIVMMHMGRVVEQGRYEDLLKDGEAFSKLIANFGATASKSEATDDETEDTSPTKEVKAKTAGPGKGPKLMQDEEREIGAISWGVYAHYARSMGSIAWGPILFGFYALAQVAVVGNSLFLGYWSAQSIPHFSQGEYMAVYAGFGVASGVFTFLGAFMLSLRAIHASYALFEEALGGVMRSRVAWFDTTPLGRITSRLTKDVTTLDNQLPMQYNMLLSQVFSVFGSIGLVFYTYPYLGIIFVPLFIIYYSFASFYRASSREVKRLDSVQRSFIYSNLGEMLSGLTSVRAYRSQEQFIAKTDKAIDEENQAYYMTVTLQRWLGIRLDFLGNILVLGISLFGVGFRNTVSPSKLGVVLTYSLSITGVFSQLVTSFATVEQDMNTSERISHYAHLPSEGALENPADPDETWPPEGKLSFQDVRMRYREGLPEVLKGVSFETKVGEKIGIVGRTGAGKSSLLQALFRICELSSGKIVIDGVDISKIGLDVLRKRISVIPQDALLFAGSVRQNLDPIGGKDDATLNDALRRAGLVAPPDADEEVSKRFAKFKLDSDVTDEGSNFSAGERQLVALCRAIAENSRIIVLDEATSSVDVETDATVQRTIQAEFSQQSMLCIAHRLATIAFYDRVMVMDAGQVAEFDEPLVLFDKEDSIFRGMCDKAKLSREDIVRIRRGAGKDT